MESKPGINVMNEVKTDCDFDPKSILAPEAQSRILQEIQTVSGVETVSLRQAINRITAEPVTSSVQVPNHTNSAMDGYALRGEDLEHNREGNFEIIGTSMAGARYEGKVSQNQCVRIMTGAVMPDGTDTVIAQERTLVDSGNMRLDGKLRPGENVRQSGEDIDVGDTAIQANVKLGAAQLGLAASLGISELLVFRKPRVAFFSNGDELRSIGSALELGDVYDSNRYTLYTMLKEMDVELLDLGIVPDDPEKIKQALLTGSESADMVITSAGASVGDADYVKELLDEIGEVNFWKVAIKPGRPLSFGKIGGATFFGLPGNPVSVMVTFQIFVKPALRKLAGEKSATSLNLSVKCLSKLKKRAGRMEYQRGILSLDENGETVVQSTGEQGSGILTSMAQANCFIILSQDSEGVDPGDRVLVQPFAGVI